MREARATMAHWLGVFIAAGQVAELRALRVKNSTYGKPHVEYGFFDADHLTDMAQAALELTASAEGVYFTLNPVNRDLLSRRCNRVGVADDSGQQSTDRDVLRRRWALIDADPVRVSGVSATDEEKAGSKEVLLAAREHLRAAGWPDPVLADSGNGYHLLYRVDLPADDGGLVQRVLAALARRFDTAEVKLDRSVFNPARIVKLYGTLARKGDDTEDRPHRWTGLLEVPPEVLVVPTETLSHKGVQAAFR